MSTDNLTPKQRAAVKQMRKILALLLPQPERRLFVAALREFVDVMLAPMRACIERQEAELWAISLAVEERLGREPSDDEALTLWDQERAKEILAMYPKSGAE
jgi:hypothetical protein